MVVTQLKTADNPGAASEAINSDARFSAAAGAVSVA
jgi:hypothetical protein